MRSAHGSCPSSHRPPLPHLCALRVLLAKTALAAALGRSRTRHNPTDILLSPTPIASTPTAHHTSRRAPQRRTQRPRRPFPFATSPTFAVRSSAEFHPHIWPCRALSPTTSTSRMRSDCGGRSPSHTTRLPPPRAPRACIFAALRLDAFPRPHTAPPACPAPTAAFTR
ncbi:hypothetical protein C8J57DRAFT_1319637, partial [Mycena rebaudengoi]